MAVIAIQDASAGNSNVTFAAASGGGDTIAQGTRAAGWDQGVQLWVRNTDAATKVVTIGGVAQAAIPATTGTGSYPVNGIYFGAPVTVTYSGVTGVTVAAVRTAPVP